MSSVSDDECAVCLGPHVGACRAPCGHVFCRECITKSFQMAKPKSCGTCPLCRSPVSIHSIVDVQNGNVLGEAPSATIWGLVFVQRGALGAGSLHFDSEKESYISYENAPDTWRFSNGKKFPSKNLLLNCSWNPSKRVFRGTAEWSALGDNTGCMYEIVFAEDYCSIVSGCVYKDGKPKPTDSWEVIFFHGDAIERGPLYWKWTPPPSTIFGCVYVQAPFYHRIAEGVGSFHFDSEDDCYISFHNATASRYLDGIPLPDRMQFCSCCYDEASRTFTAAVHLDPPEQGAVHCKYELVFAEDFSRIIKGTCQPSDEDGNELPKWHVADPFESTNANLSRCYVGRPRSLCNLVET